MTTLTIDNVTQVFEHLDVQCYNCHGTGKSPVTTQNDCDVCYGTGYQVTQAGVELLNFLRRQRKRIEKGNG